MSWKVREEGSPQVRDGLSLEQVLDGLEQGEWGPTDEVRGPGDRDWTRFENHPKFADAVAMEPLPRHEDEETHIDMTPIIDVAMVLLVFFILIITYSKLERRLASAKAGQAGVRRLTKEEQSQTIEIDVSLEDGKAVYRVSGDPNPVPRDQLGAKLSNIMRTTGHATVLVAPQGHVPFGDVIDAEDTAAGLGLTVQEALQPENKAP